MHNCLHFSDMFQVSLELKKKGFYIFIITYHKSELLRPACNNYSSPVSVSLFLLIHIVLCNLNILYGPLRFLFKNGKQGIAASRARSSSFLIVQVFLNKSLRSIGQLSLVLVPLKKTTKKKTRIIIYLLFLSCEVQRHLKNKITHLKIYIL